MKKKITIGLGTIIMILGFYIGPVISMFIFDRDLRIIDMTNLELVIFGLIFIWPNSAPGLLVTGLMLVIGSMFVISNEYTAYYKSLGLEESLHEKILYGTVSFIGGFGFLLLFCAFFNVSIKMQ